MFRDCDLTGSTSDVDIILSPLDEDSSVESENMLLMLNETKVDAGTKSDGASENSDGKFLITLQCRKNESRSYIHDSKTMKK